MELYMTPNQWCAVWGIRSARETDRVPFGLIDALRGAQHRLEFRREAKTILDRWFLNRNVSPMAYCSMVESLRVVRENEDAGPWHGNELDIVTVRHITAVG